MQYYSTCYCECNPVMQQPWACMACANRFSATVPGSGIRNICKLCVSMYDTTVRHTIMTIRDRP